MRISGALSLSLGESRPAGLRLRNSGRETGERRPLRERVLQCVRSEVDGVPSLRPFMPSLRAYQYNVTSA